MSVGKLKGRNHMTDLGIDVRIILKFVAKKLGVNIKTQLNWLRLGQNPEILWTG
jgi:hypothetical protein